MKRIVLAVMVVAALAGGVLVRARAAAAAAGGNPLLEPSVTPEHGSVVGSVVQRLPAGGYVYLEVRDEHGAPLWLVTLDGPATHSSSVSATLLARAERFHSARLARDFAPLHFVSLSPVVQP